MQGQTSLLSVLDTKASRWALPAACLLDTTSTVCTACRMPLPPHVLRAAAFCAARCRHRHHHLPPAAARCLHPAHADERCLLPAAPVPRTRLRTVSAPVPTSTLQLRFTVAAVAFFTTLDMGSAGLAPPPRVLGVLRAARLRPAKLALWAEAVARATEARLQMPGAAAAFERGRLYGWPYCPGLRENREQLWLLPVSQQASASHA